MVSVPLVIHDSPSRSARQSTGLSQTPHVRPLGHLSEFSANHSEPSMVSVPLVIHDVHPSPRARPRAGNHSDDTFPRANAQPAQTGRL